MTINMNQTLLYFALKYDGEFIPIYNALKNKQPVNYEEYQRLTKNIKYSHITILDHRYPNFLKKLNAPPILLFYEGNLNLLKDENSIRYEQYVSGKRYISTINPIHKNNEMIFDYVILAESSEDLKELSKHMKSKDLKFKDYSKKKVYER